MIYKALFGVFAFLMIVFLPSSNQAQSIGELDNGNGRYIDGCGSPQIWPKGRGSYGGNGAFYVVPNNGGNGAVMKLDGRVINLLKSGGATPRKLRKGSAFTHIYKGGGYVVRISYTVAKVIYDPDDEGGYNYAVIITATKGKSSKSVRGDSSDSC